MTWHILWSARCSHEHDEGRQACMKSSNLDLNAPPPIHSNYNSYITCYKVGLQILSAIPNSSFEFQGKLIIAGPPSSLVLYLVHQQHEGPPYMSLVHVACFRSQALIFCETPKCCINNNWIRFLVSDHFGQYPPNQGEILWHSLPNWAESLGRSWYFPPPQKTWLWNPVLGANPHRHEGNLVKGPGWN